MLSLSQLTHSPLLLSARGSLVPLQFWPLTWCHLNLRLLIFFLAILIIYIKKYIYRYTCVCVCVFIHIDMMYVLSCFCHVQLFVTPWTVASPVFSVHGDSAGKNTGEGCHALLQGSFPT